MKKIKIIQPGRLGDIFICLPISYYYHELGYEVKWPIFKQYAFVKDYVNYVDFYPIEWNVDRCYSSFPGYENLDILLGFNSNKNDRQWERRDLSFDAFKYQLAGLDISEKFKLKINRKSEKESELLDLLVKEPFCFVHDEGSNYHYDFKLDGDIIRYRPIDGFTMIDWLGVIEKAEKSYFVDSSFLNLVNGLGIAKGKRYFKRRSSPKLTPVLDTDWKEFEE
jgi:hypothetical protein